MAEYIIQEETLVGIADAIRSKTGESGQIAVADMAEKISEIAVDEKVETTVALDFSEGDMEVVPEDGTVFSSVSIPTPTTLIPENIAEGVDIAGIIGTLVAGGGGNKVCDSGTFTGISGNPAVIEHKLGVTPDLIVIYTSGAYYADTTKKHVRHYVGLSSALSEATGDVFSNSVTYLTYLGLISGTRAYRVESGFARKSTAFGGSAANIDSPTAGLISYVYAANENSFSLRNDGTIPVFEKTLTYTWFAFGGLT